MQEPFVSIIMGVYNEENNLEKCIDSILRQTYTNWEFIICNDCSKDGTQDILNEYTRKDKRIRVLNNNENSGLASALNNCLAVAGGEYIARMDADDISLPERLEVQVAYMEAHPEIDCVGCNRILFDETGNRGIFLAIEYPDKRILLKATPFAHPTIMMKKCVYDELGGYTVSKDTTRAEDLDLWIRFYAKGYKGYNLQFPLYKYHVSREDYKKRSFKAAVQTSKVYMRGYEILNFPWYSRIYALKPIISALLPNSFMYKYHKSKEVRAKL